MAAIYPFKLCKAILEGLKDELDQRGRLIAYSRIAVPKLPPDSDDDDNLLELQKSFELLALHHLKLMNQSDRLPDVLPVGG